MFFHTLWIIVSNCQVETECRPLFSNLRMYENDKRNREPLERINHLKLRPYKQKLPHLPAKTDMKNWNKTLAWVLANDAGGHGRPECLNSGLARRAGSLSPARCTGVKVWLLAVCVGRTRTNARKSTQECPALPSPITLCQFVSAICAGPPPSAHTETRQKQVKMAAPGGAVMTAVAEEAAGRCAELLRGGLATNQASPGSRFNHLAIPTPSRLWGWMQRAPHHDLHPPCPTSSRRNRWWRLGFWSFSSGSAAVYLSLLL